MALEIIVNGRNMSISERTQEYVTKRASRLDKYMTGIDEAQIDLAYAKTARNANDRQVAQITVRGKKFVLRSEERSDDILAAYDKALSKMQRQIERYKGKHHRGRGDGKSVADVALEDPEFELEEDFADMDAEAPLIVKRKRFILTPMDEYEAIEQMQLLGHEDFFLFYNVNTSGINVLYKRRDETYGLIEPEIG